MNTTFIRDDDAGARPPAATPGTRRSIELDIAGADMMLRGRFSDWESGLALGPDLDRVGVRLAIDATSPAAKGERLFAFRSRAIERIAAGTYTAQGTFTGPAGSKATEMTIETPPGHSALFVLSFDGETVDFGDGWHDLIENVAPFGDGPRRQAHGWLTLPVLAAA